MKKICLYPLGTTAGCRAGAAYLARAGVETVDHPSPEVTHLLLDVPSFGADGQLRGGGDLGRILEMLPERLTVIGGRLDHPALGGYKTLDLLKDEGYLAENAAITADCALRLAGPLLERTFRDTPALILGWGRIGKCLAQMLKALGSEVTVAARSARDRGLLEALGYRAAEPSQVPGLLKDIRLLYNTVPAKILDAEPAPGCICIDLASTPGLWCSGVVYARGLPGLHAPETVGKLIGKTLFNKFREGRT
ncbi:MAG: hypothetical protein Q4F17_11275 [Eubacteriales bacterium]|nr:hypothetical protein [Eubacteriales bacterium]